MSTRSVHPIAALALLAGGLAATGPGCSSDPVTCGDTLCQDGEACVVQEQRPACTDRASDTDPCPAGTSATNCGGAGTPCCCGPTPAPSQTCTATDCGADTDCACFTCGVDAECVDQEPGTVECRLLPEA